MLSSILPSLRLESRRQNDRPLTLQHFRFRKVTPKLEEKMKILAENKLSYYKIAKILGLATTTVTYHLDIEKRKNILERAKKSLINHVQSNEPDFFLRALAEKKKAYNRKYLRDRYHKDPEFRAKVIRANNGGRFKEEEN